jgi:hypothetical protein
MRLDIVPRGIFPDYELHDHTGNLRKLSEPSVLAWSTHRCLFESSASRRIKKLALNRDAVRRAPVVPH